MLPKYSQYSLFLDRIRLGNRKPRYGKAFKVLSYPISMILILLFIGMFLAIVKSAMSNNSRNRYSYRTSDQYRKVIKEGVFFDTIEYHQR